MKSYRALNSFELSEIITELFNFEFDENIHQIEKKIIRVFQNSLTNLDVPNILFGPIFSFGSSSRGTYTKNKLDFDIAIGVKTSCCKWAELIFKNYDFIKNKVLTNLEKEHIRPRYFSTLKTLPNKPWLYFFINNLFDANLNHRIHQIDVTFNLEKTQNIGFINKEIIEERLIKVASDLGGKQKEDLINQIRLTKTILHQQLSLIDESGQQKSPIQTARILGKGGFRSVNIEHMILELCTKNSTGDYIDIGSFDKLMQLIRSTNLAYRVNNPSVLLAPLSFALRFPGLLQIKRLETIARLHKSEKKALPIYLQGIKESYIKDFKDEHKWLLLAKMANDYFTMPHFCKNYQLT